MHVLYDRLGTYINILIENLLHIPDIIKINISSTNSSPSVLWTIESVQKLRFCQQSLLTYSVLNFVLGS